MRRVRRVLLGLWAGALSVAGLADLTAASGTGLFAPTVCISPAVLLALVLTPTDTLADLFRAFLPDTGGATDG